MICILRFILIISLFSVNTIFAEEKDDLDDIGNSTLIGDMILDNDQMKFLSSTNDSKFENLALENPFKLWPNATVFYLFDKSIHQDVTAKNILTEAMQKIENASCIRFETKTDDSLHYVLMKKGRICSSKVGFRNNGPQPLIIDPNLCSVGSVVHEMLHTLSFLHMHTAKNRDEFIEINWNNIRDDAKVNFKTFSIPVTMLETEYDYDSITHYSNYAFAKNKQTPTIIAKNPDKATNMGQRKDLSKGDIMRLNRLYQCKGYEMNSTKIQNETISASNVSASVNMTTMDDDGDDMVLTKEQIETLFSTKSAKRNGLKSAFHHWPAGTVPFQIDPTFKPQFISTIMEAMNYISNRTCIRFARKTPQHQNYIYITKGPGCSSEVGMRRTGKQLMNINENLCPRGKIIHELLHALSFLHMHTANERDNYLKVNWDNIKDNAKFNFKQFVAHVSMFSTPYDYNSIMHYSPKAFAKDRSKLTLIPVQSAASIHMGQREGMSIGDIVRLNRMYKCGAPYISTMPATIKTATEPPKGIVVAPKKLNASNRTIFGVLIFKSIELH